MERRRIDCPYCGWYRDYTTDLRVVFDHPVWGKRTSKEIAALDAREHRCDDHREAKKRAAEMREWHRGVLRGSIGTPSGVG